MPRRTEDLTLAISMTMILIVCQHMLHVPCISSQDPESQGRIQKWTARRARSKNLTSIGIIENKSMLCFFLFGSQASGHQALSIFLREQNQALNQALSGA